MLVTLQYDSDINLRISNASSVFIKYDLVDITRQVLAKLSNQVFIDVINAYQDNNAS